MISDDEIEKRKKKRPLFIHLLPLHLTRLEIDGKELFFLVFFSLSLFFQFLNYFLVFFDLFCCLFIVKSLKFKI